MKGTKFVFGKIISILLILLLLSLLGFYTYFRLIKETTFRVYDPLSAELSEEVNKRIDEIPVINGIQVVRADLKKNARYLIHAYHPDPELRKLYVDFTKTRITTEVPIFSNDFIQNSRVVRLMNHEFDCSPYKETVSYKYVPESAKYALMVCSISIPPAYGEFKGLLAVTLSRKPTEDELANIKFLLLDLSDKIYKEIQ